MHSTHTTKGLLGLALAVGLTGGGWSFALAESGSSSNELLLNANSLIGNTVLDKSGKELGTVKDLQIDQKSGQIAYIILSYGGTFGGTLGIGSENYSIPWKEVTLTKRDGEMLIEVAKAPIEEKTTTRQQTTARHTTGAAPVNEDFNTSTVETLEGTVENVDHDMFEEGVAVTDSVVLLDVTTANGKQRVRVAPETFLKNQGVEIKEGDAVEVTGSRINRDGEDLILASKVTLQRNGKVLALRQDDGTPKWTTGEGIQTKSQSMNK